MRPALGDNLMPLQDGYPKTVQRAISLRKGAATLTWLGRLAMPIPSEKGAAIVHRRDDRQGVEGEERGGGV